MTVRQWYDDHFPCGLPMVVETENEIRRTFIVVLTQYDNEVVAPLRQAGALWTQDKAALETQVADLKEELQSVLDDWNAIVKASGSPTNGGAVGHVAQMKINAQYCAAHHMEAGD